MKKIFLIMLIAMLAAVGAHIALEAGAGAAASRVIPGMNHVFKEINDPGDQMTSYSNPSYPLHHQLVPALAEFLLDLR